MVIIDEKQLQMLPPPPPYDPRSAPAVPHVSAPLSGPASSLEPISPPPFPARTPRAPAALATLPPSVLLYIVHHTLPQTERDGLCAGGYNNGSSGNGYGYGYGSGGGGGGGACGVYGGEDGKVERQRKVLYWMAIALRLVNRSLYIACMHVLRSTYLPAYTSMIRAPYTSDPFPLSSCSSSSPFPSSSPAHTPGTPAPAHRASPVTSMQRETAVLDQFIALKVRADVWADDSELHVERGELFKDLFDLMQPRARLEDLVRAYALDAGVVSVSGSGSAGGNAVVAVSSTADAGCAAACAPSFTLSRAPPYSSSPSFPLTTLSSPHSGSAPPRPARKIPFSALSCAFSPRSAGIIHTSRAGKRTIVEVARSRDERLELAARRLVRGLVSWVEESY